MLVAKERRQSERIKITGFAKILYRADSLPRDCRVTDVSDGGVRLHTEATDVPDDFILVLGGGDVARRDCRVVWRLGCEIGAEFVGHARPGFARIVSESSRGSR